MVELSFVRCWIDYYFIKNTVCIDLLGTKYAYIWTCSHPNLQSLFFKKIIITPTKTSKRLSITQWEKITENSEKNIHVPHGPSTTWWWAILVQTILLLYSLPCLRSGPGLMGRPAHPWTIERWRKLGQDLVLVAWSTWIFFIKKGSSIFIGRSINLSVWRTVHFRSVWNC